MPRFQPITSTTVARNSAGLGLAKFRKLRNFKLFTVMKNKINIFLAYIIFFSCIFLRLISLNNKSDSVKVQKYQILSLVAKLLFSCIVRLKHFWETRFSWLLFKMVDFFVWGSLWPLMINKFTHSVDKNY